MRLCAGVGVHYVVNDTYVAPLFCRRPDKICEQRCVLCTKDQ